MNFDYIGHISLIPFYHFFEQSEFLMSNKTVKENLYLATYFKKIDNNRRDKLIDQILTELDIFHTKDEQVSIPNRNILFI